MQILTIENPKDAAKLRKISKKINNIKKDLQTPEMTLLFQAMKEICKKPNVAGVAAPQLGVAVRIFALNFGKGTMGFFVNPKVLNKSKETKKDYEGCLSVPGKSGLVESPTEIELEWYNEKGEKFKHTFRDFWSRAVSHELNHLAGKLYIDIVEGEVFDENEMKQKFLDAQSKSHVVADVNFVNEGPATI